MCLTHPPPSPPVSSPTYISVVVSSLATKIKHTPNGEHTDYPQIVYQCYAKSSSHIANNSQKVIKRGRRNIKSYRASSHSHSMVVFFDMICYCWQGKTGGSVVVAKTYSTNLQPSPLFLDLARMLEVRKLQAVVVWPNGRWAPLATLFHK